MSEPQEIAFVLNRVDRSRKILFTTIAVLFVFVLLTLGMLLAHLRMDDGGRSKVLFLATAAEMAFIGACAVLVAFHVTRMTKTVLHAIELRTKK